MAVARMKKVTLLGHSSVRAALTRELQQEGLIQISLARQDGEGEPPEHLGREIHQLELAVHKASFLLDFLEQFADEKRGFVRGMMARRVYLTHAEYETIEGKIPFEQLYDEAERLDEKLNSIRAAGSRLQAQIQALQVWQGLDVPLEMMGPTRQTRLFLGLLPSDAVESLRAVLSETAPETVLETVSEAARQTAIAVLAHQSIAGEVQSVLQLAGFKPVSFDAGPVGGTAAEVIEGLRREAASVEREESKILDRIAELRELRDDILVLREHIHDKLGRAIAEERFYHTEQSFLLEGWARAADTKAIADKAKSVSEAVEVAVTEPGREDNPPVILENARIFKPFESLTRLYGYPSHKEIDPTPIMAPFFFLFFGLALGDFGYGLVLALACRFLIRKYDLQGNVRQFMHLLIAGGLSSMIVGVLTGSYFGSEAETLPAVLRSVILIDPLNQALEFLIFTIALGVLQVVGGVIVEAVDSVRHGDWKGAVLDQLTTVFLLLAGVVAFSAWIGTTASKSPSAALLAVLPVSVFVLGLAVALVVLFQGRVYQGFGEAVRVLTGRAAEAATQRRGIAQITDGVIALVLLLVLFAWVAALFLAPALSTPLGQALAALAVTGLLVSPISRKSVGKVFMGAYTLYGMLGYIGDFLSYARLMALGLATVLIGMVINILARLVFATPYVGIPLGVAILIVGHGFNLVINLLSAFVHPTRLQFVEFFSKFYEDGGDKFSPLAVSTRHLIFVPKEGS
ncbi:MAG: V-type ATP synthase subunit I [Actinobacteria bacterium]|nr:MAG: V-type ATP synthase subunit I [Actinomycetota bacterium]